MVQGRWTLLSNANPLARSSHCVSVTKSGLLTAYGGELKPRTPVDTGNGEDDSPRGSLHAFDLNKGNLTQDWLTLAPTTEGKLQAESVPEPRVGATVVCHQDALYMWGGRGGQQMTPLDAHQTGLWKATIKLSHPTLLWERIAAHNEDQAPSPRSYHTAVAHGDNLYVHAGCPDSGRLSTLHAFDLTKQTWRTLASGPEPGRGGTCLVPAVLQGPVDVLLRYGGFSGHELPTTAGSVDVYSVAEDKWFTVEPAPDQSHGHPGPRSVHGFSPFQSQSPSLSNATAILYHGERDASTLGHAGAGTFWNDVWVLTKDPGDGILSGWAWHKVDVGQADVPEGRGWFPSASWVDPEGNTRVLMFGGLLSSNERTGELWELRVD